MSCYNFEKLSPELLEYEKKIYKEMYNKDFEEELREMSKKQFIQPKDWRLLPALKSWLDRNLWLVVIVEIILFLVAGYVVWRQIVI